LSTTHDAEWAAIRTRLDRLSKSELIDVVYGMMVQGYVGLRAIRRAERDVRVNSLKAERDRLNRASETALAEHRWKDCDRLSKASAAAFDAAMAVYDEVETENRRTR